MDGLLSNGKHNGRSVLYLTALCALISIIFAWVLWKFTYGFPRFSHAFMGVCLFAALMALFLNTAPETGISGKYALLFIALAVTAMSVRFFLLPYKSADFGDFLSPWMTFYRENGGFKAIGRPIGDYNIPYLYFLALFSYFPVDDLMLIKLLSVLFDVLLALYALKLVKLFGQSDTRTAAAFFAVLLLPTVALNSAKWAQCDSIYSALALMSVYHALAGSPRRAVIFAALSFSFKLQAIFILPVFALFWICGRVKFRHLLLFPAVYLLLVLPSVFAGRSLLSTVLIYFNQADSYSGYLTLNAPSVFSFLKRTPENIAPFSAAGIICAAAVILFCVYCAFRHRRDMTDKTLLLFGLFLSLAIPFLLPSMHERYYYIAETLSTVCVFVLPLGFLLPTGIQAASLLAYDAYFHGVYRVYLELGGAFNLLALICMARFIRKNLT